MGLQILQIIKTSSYTLIAPSIMAAYSLVLLYLDQFIFFAPYFVVYVPLTSAGNFVLDVALGCLTGIVLIVSIAQIRLRGTGPNRFVRTGVIGALIAIFAGACPCYYMFPLLAMAGGLGGVFGALGIMLNAYQIPLKMASLTMLCSVVYGLERSLRTQCAAPDAGVTSAS